MEDSGARRNVTSVTDSATSPGTARRTRTGATAATASVTSPGNVNRTRTSRPATRATRPVTWPGIVPSRGRTHAAEAPATLATNRDMSPGIVPNPSGPAILAVRPDTSAANAIKTAPAEIK